MIKMLRVPVVLLAVGCCLPLFLAGPGASAGNGPTPAAAVPPDLVLRQIHLVETRGESTLWEVWADQAEIREQEGLSVLSRVSKPVEVVLYFTQGRLRCTANRALIDLKTKDVRLEGEVVARSDQGAQVETESVRWIAASRRLVTDQFVTVTRGGLMTRGRGMEAETSLERVRIFQNITSVLQPSGPGRKGATR
jgi:LPS export ABC transporter protein LptC